VNRIWGMWNLRLITGSSILHGLVLTFLAVNLIIRFGSIFNYPPHNGAIAVFFGAVIAACVWTTVRPRHLKYFLFLFGFSFFLYGAGSVDIHSRIFELVVTLVAATLFVINRKTKHTHRLSRSLRGLLFCYVAFSIFSLLLLPVRQIVKDLWVFGFPDACFYLFIDPPYGIYYPVSAVIRLILFVILGIELARTDLCHENYKWLFSSIFVGAVFCTIIGLMDLYGIISLAAYRFGITAGVLQSTFLNRGWFAEFILTAVPFVLIGFMSRIKGRWWMILLFASLVLCEIALILAGARAGWVSYPLILFICWLFFYYAKEGRLTSFRFSWKDLVKVGISVPVTIVISFLIVFQVLMPLSDHLRDSKGKAVDQRFKATSQYLEGRVTQFTETGRVDTWKDSILVGSEGPWLGRGYEAYYWNATVLENIPLSPYMKNRVHKEIRQTPHNIFVQIFVSGGMVGLGLWLLAIGYAIMLLTIDLVQNKRLLNTPVIISIIAFHIYGIFQSMQYIPMIWSMIFLCLGYAMTIDDGVLPPRLRRWVSKVVIGAVIMVGVAFFFYLYNFESRNLAEKYGLRVYAMDQDLDRFAGFYQDSKRWKYGDFRWCGKRGSVMIAERGVRNAERQGLKAEEGGQRTEDGVRNAERAPVERPGREPGSTGQGTGSAEDLMVKLAFYCLTPGVAEEPVVVTVSHEGEVVDEIFFDGRQSEVGSRQEKGKKRKGKKDKGFTVRRTYEVPIRPGEEEGWLDIEVSRTWIPHNHLGNFDRRELGIGVKILDCP
jgi:O-antigen ligase